MQAGVDAGGLAVGEIPHEPVTSLTPGVQLSCHTPGLVVHPPPKHHSKTSFTKYLPNLKVLCMSHSRIDTLSPCFGGVRRLHCPLSHPI